MRSLPLLFLLACGGDPGDTDTAATADTDTDTTPGFDPAAKEAELLARLQSEFPEYPTWQQIEGWDEIVPTTIQTHDDSVLIFYNDLAMQDLVDEVEGASSFKEVYNKDGEMWTVHAITLDDEYGWFYAIFSPDGTVEESGDLLACFGCHEGATSQGFLAPELEPPPAR